MGKGIVSDALDRAQKERELAMREKAAARDESEYQYRLQQRAEVEALKAELKNPNADNYALKGSGVGLSLPAQPAAPQGDTDFAPASYGLDAPAGGYGLRAARAPAPSADAAPAEVGVGLRANAQLPATGATFKPRKTRSEEQDVLARMALVSNDINGFNSARNNQRTFDLDDINAGVAKLTPDELKERAQKLNLPNTKIPMLYTGETKGGYKFLSTDPATGAVSKEFTLSDSQVRQMVAAQQMADKGFGTEAMAALAGVDKDVADHITKWNQTLQAVATSNNDALGKQDTVRLKEKELDQTAEYRNKALAIQGASARREARNPLTEKINAMEAALGRKLTEKELSRAIGLGGAAVDPAELVATAEKLQGMHPDMSAEQAMLRARRMFGVEDPPIDDSALLKKTDATSSVVKRPGGLTVRDVGSAYGGDPLQWWNLRGQAAGVASRLATGKQDKTK